MNRREAIKRMGVLAVGTLSASTLAGIMGGCTADDAPSVKLRVLSEYQNEQIITLAEHIIPATDTPGATDAQVNRFVDKMLAEWYPDESRDKFLDGLNQLDEFSKSSKEQSFLSLTSENQVAVVQQLQNRVSNNYNDNDPLSFFYKITKELTVVGYYTSQPGATEELQSNIIPGTYEGCVPYNSIGSAWSLAGT